MKGTIIGLTACAIAAAAQADELKYSRQYDDCMKRAEGVTASTIICITEEHRRWDVELNQQYRAIRAKLPDSRRNTFDNAQHAWLGFRTANCSFYNNPDGGSLARIEANLCMLEMTARRTVELRGIRDAVDQ